MGADVQETEGMLQFRAEYEERQIPVTLHLEGQHYVPDALAAISVGIALGVEDDKIRKSLAGFENMSGRQEIFQSNGYTIIKDCYNAGPESMSAALSVLGNKSGRRIAVLGDMLELGVCTPAEHYKIGRLAAEKADILLAYGPNSSRVLNGAITGGMPDTRASAFEDREKLVSALKRIAKPGDVLLFKGSRGMQMDVTLEMFLREDK
jgi:UDP-N-acetylmuramoyl-tripeptide--D-alanyl-D-alanine ligase